MMKPIALMLAVTCAVPALAVADEVIHVEGTHPDVTPPRPIEPNPFATPPYSDEALLQDTWTTAWFMIDVDEQGVARHYKWLKKPGLDLEPVALAEIRKLKFQPAIGADGKPLRVNMLWRIEWPSASWLQTIMGTRSRAPRQRPGPYGRNHDAAVPCRGSGPMNLGMARPVYKDCWKPAPKDLKGGQWFTMAPASAK